MHLRKLEMKDAPLMLEWMHDEKVVKDLQTNFAEKTIEDCEGFIRGSFDESENLHLAVADEDDTYMGTVSLKHIDDKQKTAEFGITIRAIAMKKGFSKYAMKEIIKKGMEEFGLEKIYWCVSKENERAIRFYDKNGYRRVGNKLEVFYKDYTTEQVEQYLWYLVEVKEKEAGD